MRPRQMAEPEQSPAEQDRLQQLAIAEQIMIARSEELQRLLLEVRTIQSAERVILLLVGAIFGIVLFKAWVGL